jgi:hypothetical protein
MADRNLSGPAWVPAFLATLAETRTVKLAVEAAGITHGSAYFRRRTNRQFAAAWEAALLSGAAAAEMAEISDPPPPRNAGWRKNFLEALAESSNVKAAAARANVPARTVYKLRREDADFAAKWLAALLEGYEHLEMEVLGYLRDPAPTRKMDVASALRLLAAHRETVARERAFKEDEDEQAVLDSIDAFIEDMRQRRAANTAILLAPDGDAPDGDREGVGADDGAL